MYTGATRSPVAVTKGHNIPLSGFEVGSEINSLLPLCPHFVLPWRKLNLRPLDSDRKNGSTRLKGLQRVCLEF